MTSPYNPYAPPTSAVDGGGSTSEYWREGAKVLHVERGADLPQRCVKCNAPAVTPIKARKLYWHHPALYLLLVPLFLPILRIFGFLGYPIVALILRKRFEVSPGLCRAHAAARSRIIAAALALFALGLGALWFGATRDDLGWALPLGMLGFIVSIVLAAIGGRTIRPVRITDGYAELKGFGEPFLKSIPPRMPRVSARFSGLSLPDPPASSGS